MTSSCRICAAQSYLQLHFTCRGLTFPRLQVRHALHKLEVIKMSRLSRREAAKLLGDAILAVYGSLKEVIISLHRFKRHGARGFGNPLEGDD